MNEEELQKLYGAVSSKFDIGDFNAFKSKMQTTEQRKNFYNVVGQKGFDLGDYNQYENRLKKKESSKSGLPKHSSASNTENISSVSSKSDKWLYEQMGEEYMLENKNKPYSPAKPMAKKKKILPTDSLGINESFLDNNETVSIYDQYKQAKALSEEETLSIKQELDAEINNEGVWNKTKTLAKNFWNNAIGRHLDEDFIADTDPLSQTKREIKKQNQNLSDEEVNLLAYQKEISKREESLVESKEREFLTKVQTDGLSDKLISEQSKAYDEVAIKRNNTVLKKAVVEKGVEDLAKNLVSLRNEIESINPSDFSSQSQLDNYNSKVLEFQKLQKDYVQTFNEYSRINKDLQVLDAEKLSFSDNLDAMKRDYGYWTNFGNRIVNALADTGRGIVTAGIEMPVDYLQGVGQNNPILNIAKESLKAGRENYEQSKSNRNSKFVKTLSIDDVKSPSDFGRYLFVDMIGGQSYNLFAASTGGVGIATISASASGTKRADMLNEMEQNGNNYNTLQQVSIPLLYGAAEGVGAYVDNLMLGRAGATIKAATQNERVLIAKGMAKEFISNSLHSIGFEVAEETSVQVFQNMLDRYGLGKKNVQLLDGVKDAAAGALFLTGTIQGGAGTIGLGLNAIKPFSYDKKIQSLSREILNYESKLTDETINESEKTLIKEGLERKYEEAKNLLQLKTKQIGSLSNEQFDELIELEKKQVELGNKAKEISNSRFEKNIKEDLLKELKNEFDSNENRRKELMDQSSNEKQISDSSNNNINEETNEITNNTTDEEDIYDAQEDLEFLENLEHDEKQELETELNNSPVLASTIDDGKIYTLNGEEGYISTDGQQIVFETPSSIHELGNINEISDSKLLEYGIEEQMELDIEFNDDNSVTFRGRKYFNPNENAYDAVNHGLNGEYSVTLLNENGNKRTIRGQYAERIAYEYKLKELENATEQQISEIERLEKESQKTSNEETIGDIEQRSKKRRKKQKRSLKQYKTPLTKSQREEIELNRLIAEEENLKEKESEVTEETDTSSSNETNNLEFKEIKLSEKGDTYKIRKEGDKIVFENSKGKKPSRKTERKLQREYAKDIDFSKGKLSNLNEFDQNISHYSTIAENSENPAEVAEAIVNINAEDYHSQLDYKQRSIAENMYKISRESFLRFSDANFINQSIAMQYFAPKNKGVAIDVLAREISEISGLEIEPNDIVEFILDNPGGTQSFLNRELREDVNKLKHRFEVLTGLPAIDEFLNLAYERGLKNDTFINEYTTSLDLIPESELEKLWIEYEKQQSKTTTVKSRKELSETENSPGSEERSRVQEISRQEDKRSQNERETRLNNRGRMGSSSTQELVGRRAGDEAIYNTTEASNSEGSKNTIQSIEEREELESRGINITGIDLATDKELEALSKDKDIFDRLNDWLDSVENDLDQFSKGTLGVNIPLVVAKGAIKSMRLALKTSKAANEIIKAGLDYIRETDWYKNLSDKEQKKINLSSVKNLISEAIRQVNKTEKVVKEHQSIIDDLRQKLVENKLSQREIHQKIIEFLKLNKINGDITETEINRLIGYSSQIISARNKEKAFDRFVDVYNTIKGKVDAREEKKQKPTRQLVEEKISKLLSEGMTENEIINSFSRDSEKMMARDFFIRQNPSDIQTVNSKMDQLMDENRQFEKEQKTFTEHLQELSQKFWINFFDRQAPVKSILKKSGLNLVKNYLIASKGAPGYAKYIFEKAYNNIYRGLSDSNIEVLDKIIAARRIIAIDENRESKGLPNIVHSFHLNSDEAKLFLANIKDEIGNELFSNLSNKATTYFNIFQEQLKEMHESGLITKETLDSFFGIEYQPTKFIEFMDRLDKNSIQLDRGSNSKNPIQKMTTGWSGAKITNSMWLLANSIGTTSRSVNLNRTNNALIREYNKQKLKVDNLKTKKDPTKKEKSEIKYFEDFQKLVFENDIIGYKKGKPIYKYPKKPIGYKEVTYYENGIEKSFFMENEMYNMYSDNLKGIWSEGKKQKISMLSGNNMVKTLATGNNPTFFITNSPRDFLWIATISDEYGKNVLLNTVKLIKDTFVGIRDIKNKSEMFQNAIRYGLMMDFLMDEGRIKKEGLITSIIGNLGKIENSSKDKLKSLFDILSLKELQAYSEIGFRMAVFNRSIKNQLNDLGLKNIEEVTDQQKKEDIYTNAVVSARQTMDFNQGGVITKDLDAIVPYLNAGTQGTRMLAEAIYNRPAETMFRIAQTSGLLAGIPIAISLAMLANDDDDRTSIEKYNEAMKGVSKFDKVNYMIMPISKNKDGEYTYIRIAKPQQLASFITLAEGTIKNTLAKSFEVEGFKDDTFENLSFGLNNNITPVEFKVNPLNMVAENVAKVPVVKAALSYKTGYDFFREQDISHMKGKVPVVAEGFEGKSVEDFYKTLGRKFNFSPARMKVAMESVFTTSGTTPVVAFGYAGMDLAFSNKKGDEQRELFIKNLKKSAFGRVVKETSEFNRKVSNDKNLKEEIEKVNAEKHILKSQTKDKINEYLEGKIKKTEVQEFIKQQYKGNANDIRKSMKMLNEAKKNNKISNETWEIKYADTNEERSLLLKAYFDNNFLNSEKLTDKQKKLKKELIQTKAVNNQTILIYRKEVK